MCIYQSRREEQGDSGIEPQAHSVYLQSLLTIMALTDMMLECKKELGLVRYKDILLGGPSMNDISSSMS